MKIVKKYFVSYNHKRGSGRCYLTIPIFNKPDLNKWESLVEKSYNLSQSIITNYKFLGFKIEK